MRTSERIKVILDTDIGDDIDELVNLVEACESDAARVCFDTGHAHVMGFGMRECLEKIGPFLATIHMHDNDGSRDQHLPTGAGTINWAEFFDTLRQMNWPHPICVELAPREMPYAEFVRRARHALAEGTTML